jgi:tetratricopeptide (TPR) repeat protein
LQARAVIQDALARANALPEWNPARIQLLNTLAGISQQDGNLLKALSYREKAVAAFETTPPGAAAELAAQPKGFQPGVASGIGTKFAANGRFMNQFGPTNSNYLYQQLADLYRQLGRSDAAEKATTKMRSLMQTDPNALASSLELEGKYDQALAVYQKQADASAAKPQAQVWELIGPLQSMAALYERQEQWTEATAVLQQAVARLDPSGDTSARN